MIFSEIGIHFSGSCFNAGAAVFAGGEGAWWSRGENRFVPDYHSRFKDLAGLRLHLV